MVATPIKPQRLSTRDGADDGGNGVWGTPQIATPAIVGGVLILLFAAYIIWQRRPHNKRPYDYHQVRSEWVSKIERMFNHRPKRQRVLHSSAPVTLDDSMRTSGFTLDFNRRSRQSRSDSSDSQTPLTLAGYTFDYPPNKPSDYPPNKLSDSPPPMPKRPVVRWWWLFGSRPQQIKSEEPGQRWRVDDMDGSSSGHGHSDRGHRYVGILEPMHEDPEDGEDAVIRIGENFASVASTPMTQHFPEQAGLIRGMPTVPELPQSFRTTTPIPATSAPQSVTGTPVSSANRGSPPSYDVSQSQLRYPSTGDTVPLAHPGPYIIPPPVRAAAYGMFHGRELSSDSILATQPPMVVTSTY